MVANTAGDLSGGSLYCAQMTATGQAAGFSVSWKLMSTTNAAMLTLLNNASAVLAAVRAAGATGVTTSSASNVQVSATVTVTVTGSNATAAMNTLQAAVNAGQLNSALVSAGLAEPAPPSSAVAVQAHVYALLMLAALLF